MSTSGFFKAVKSFYVGGQLVRAGATLPLEDRDVIDTLLSAGKIEAADDQTKSRVGNRDPVTSSEAKDENNLFRPKPSPWTSAGGAHGWGH